MITFFVPGIPAPKGSYKGYAFRSRKTGKYRAAITNDCKRTKPWQEQIAAVARANFKNDPYKQPAGVFLDITFYLTRPKSVSLKKFPYPTKKPDRDKLLRAVQDALKSIIYQDDSQVIDGPTKNFGPMSSTPLVCLLLFSS